ncbi:MAG: HNH endonuclease [Caldilinea sp.]
MPNSPRSFTHYWSNTTWQQHAASASTSELPDHAASNLFRVRGIQPGDQLYIVTLRHGALYLLTKLRIAAVCDVEEAADLLATAPELLWEAEDHVVADAAAPANFDRPVPLAVAQALRFVSGGEPKPLKFQAEDRIDQQTLRGVRELTAESAARLDALLPPLQPLYLAERRAMLLGLPGEVMAAETLWEGAVRQVTVNAYERNPRARALCIAHWGLDCVVCGFNFEERYSTAARGYIHVHHLRPLAAIGAAYVLDPVRDLVPVCPNCHAVIHLRREGVYSIDEVREMMDHHTMSPGEASA